ncbi:hypothetical protein O9G_001559 [Rozella allomycis CSF55]|uniref:PNK FHA domain-containing protein n=1 Tax=Rozella allomycis (strain CSF55) TaxID=988480 RepID=A0A075B211_ROZAC|nr:hypothetical protein O9G_001559 [Rozella allomycis CSF55]|eukprot:EPZ36575.1 hypothetical protein O9G_001559 [Rozella allomycis CSF55]
MLSTVKVTYKDEDYDIPKETPYFLGRSNLLGISDPNVSRKQVCIFWNNESCYIETLGLNPSHFMDQIMEKGKRYIIKNGEYIELLPSKYKFVLKILEQEDSDYFDQTLPLNSEGNEINENELSESSFKLMSESQYSHESHSDGVSSESDFIGNFIDIDSDYEALKVESDLSSFNLTAPKSNNSTLLEGVPKFWKQKSYRNFVKITGKLLEEEYPAAKAVQIRKMIKSRWDELDELEQQSYYPKEERE